MTHSTWFHFTRQGRYYAAVDEVREPHAELSNPKHPNAMTWDQRRGRADAEALYSDQNGHGGTLGMALHPLGKLPGSVWTIADEPLTIPLPLWVNTDHPPKKGGGPMTPFADRDGIRLWHADARRVSEFIEPESVDCLITSPPYFTLRSYTDGGEHYDGQIGSEPTPTEFVDALIECTADWLKVLKPSGSIFVNLGDKYAGSGGHNNSAISDKSTLQGNGHIGGGPKIKATRRSAPDRYNQASDGIPAKSLMGLPWRYALRCIDELGLILRAEIIWSKPNGLPESVTDRVRRSHEQWFHLTRQGRYYAAVDEVREAHAEPQRAGVLTWDERRNRDDHAARYSDQNGHGGTAGMAQSPLGKLPGSVWSIPSEPLQVPDHLGVDHFAAFPTEWPRRLILGWSPNGICVECGEGRRPVVAKESYARDGSGTKRLGKSWTASDGPVRHDIGNVLSEATITGYACACPTPDAPTRPAVICDPFLGTGTTLAVARALGRHGHGVDLSNDYLRLAEWRIFHDDATHRKARTRSGIATPELPKIDGQMSFLDGAA